MLRSLPDGLGQTLATPVGVKLKNAGFYLPAG
jgi:hypothetical protein